MHQAMMAACTRHGGIPPSVLLILSLSITAPFSHAIRHTEIGSEAGKEMEKFHHNASPKEWIEIQGETAGKAHETTRWTEEAVPQPLALNTRRTTDSTEYVMMKLVLNGEESFYTSNQVCMRLVTPTPQQCPESCVTCVTISSFFLFCNEVSDPFFPGRLLSRPTLARNCRCDH